MNLNSSLARHSDGTLNVEASLNNLNGVVKHRLEFEQAVRATLVEVIEPYSDKNKILLLDLTYKVVHHPSMVDFAADAGEVPDVLRLIFKHHSEYKVVKGTYGGIFHDREQS